METSPQTHRLYVVDQVLHVFTNAPYEAFSAPSTRPRTTNYTQWYGVEPWTTVNAPYFTPNIAGVIQEIISHPNWQTNNPITLFFAGSGTRTAYSFEGANSVSILCLNTPIHSFFTQSN
jgi:hypothetical protein